MNRNFEGKFIIMAGNAIVFVTKMITDNSFKGICLSSPTLTVRIKPFEMLHTHDTHPNPQLVIDKLRNGSYEVSAMSERTRLLKIATDSLTDYKPEEAYNKPAHHDHRGQKEKCIKTHGSHAYA